MRINKTKLIAVFILFPLIAGLLVGFIIKDYIYIYDVIKKPAFAPPSNAFQIIWPILYILMGISSYLVFISNSNGTRIESALKTYILQLIINLLYSIIFFKFRLFFIAFLWIVLLIFAVVAMITSYYGVSKRAALLQIPYLIWCVFAAFLNFFIYLLN